MILAFFDEYLEFFIILFSIILIMILVYFIFFRPKSSKKNIESTYENEVTEDLEKDNFIDNNDDVIFDKDNYVLGQNSNLLESISPNGDVEVIVGQNVFKVEGSFADDETKVIEDSEKVVNPKTKKPKSKNDFKEVDDLIEKQFKISSDPDTFYDYEPPKEVLDPENELNRIVETVITKENIPADFGKYHVSHKKDNKKWYVKREGEDSPERELVTKTEAIAYATIKALEYNTSIVVHDEDGKISKYNF